MASLSVNTIPARELRGGRIKWGWQTANRFSSLHGVISTPLLPNLTPSTFDSNLLPYSIIRCTVTEDRRIRVRRFAGRRIFPPPPVQPASYWIYPASFLMCTRGRFPREEDVWGSEGVAPLPHTSSCPGGSLIQPRDKIHAAILGCLSPRNPKSRLAKMRLLGVPNWLAVFQVVRKLLCYVKPCIGCMLIEFRTACK